MAQFIICSHFVGTSFSIVKVCLIKFNVSIDSVHTTKFVQQGQKFFRKFFVVYDIIKLTCRFEFVVLVLRDFLFDFANTLEINVFQCCWAIFVVFIISWICFRLGAAFSRVDCCNFHFWNIGIQLSFLSFDSFRCIFELTSFLFDSLFCIFDSFRSLFDFLSNRCVTQTISRCFFFCYIGFLFGHFSCGRFLFCTRLVYSILCLSCIRFGVDQFFFNTFFFVSCCFDDSVLLFYNRISIFRYRNVFGCLLDCCFSCCFISFRSLKICFYKIKISLSLFDIFFSTVYLSLRCVHCAFCFDGCCWLCINSISVSRSGYTSNTCDDSCTKSCSFHCIFHKVFYLI